MKWFGQKSNPQSLSSCFLRLWGQTTLGTLWYLPTTPLVIISVRSFPHLLYLSSLTPEFLCPRWGGGSAPAPLPVGPMTEPLCILPSSQRRCPCHSSPRSGSGPSPPPFGPATFSTATTIAQPDTSLVLFQKKKHIETFQTLRTSMHNIFQRVVESLT